MSSRPSRASPRSPLPCPDDMHGRGIATLLLEHLVSAGRGRGLRAFTAGALPENRPMLGVFADAGLPVHQRMTDRVVPLTFPIPAGDDDRSLDDYLDSVAAREPGLPGCYQIPL